MRTHIYTLYFLLNILLIIQYSSLYLKQLYNFSLFISYTGKSDSYMSKLNTHIDVEDN